MQRRLNRSEHSWPQAQLAERIGSDAHEVTRYENGRVAPSFDVLAHPGATLSTTIDYLVIDSAPRRHTPGYPSLLSDGRSSFQWRSMYSDISSSTIGGAASTSSEIAWLLCHHSGTGRRS